MFYSGSGLSTVNYDALLIGWEGQSSYGGFITFDAGTSTYTPGGAAATAHNSLDVTHNWTINDGGPAPIDETVWITSNAEDAYSFPYNSSFVPAGGYLLIGMNDDPGEYCDGIMLFHTNIPQGATVNTITLTLRGSVQGSGNNWTMNFNDVGIPIMPTNYSQYTALALTSGSVIWDTGMSSPMTSPNLASIAQPVINKVDFNGDLLLTVKGGYAGVWGSWRRIIATDYSGNPNGPQLTVTY